MAESSDLIGRNFGGELLWDDVRIPATSATVAGSNPPDFTLFKNNGAAPAVGYALSSDGNNDYATIPHADSGATPVFDFASSWSLSFWAVIDPSNTPNDTLFYHPQWGLRIGVSGKLIVRLSGYSDQTSTGVYNIGARNHIVMTIEESGGLVNVVVYVDTMPILTASLVGTLAADAGGDVNVFSNAGTTRFTEAVMDDIRFYDKVLDATDIADLYNDEQGTEEDVALANTTCHYKLNEGTGTTAADYIYPGATTHIMTLTNGVAWTNGIVEVTNPEQGVFLYAFSPDQEQELFFTVQLPHTWIEYAKIYPHVHWSVPDNNSGTVVWGLEYVWANVNAPFGNTSVLLVEGEAAGEGYHRIAGFDPIEGTDKKISSMLVGRVFRKAYAAEDTYTEVAYLLEIDFHIQNDAASIEEYHK